LGAQKLLTFVEIGRRVRRCGATLYQKVEIFIFFGGGRFPTPRAPIEVKFRTAKRTDVPLCLAKF